MVRFPTTEPKLQNFRIKMLYTDRVVLWDGIDEHAPDLAFLLLPQRDDRRSKLLVRYLIISTESATIAPKTQKTPWAKAYAISGAGSRRADGKMLRLGNPWCSKKAISGLFGASKIIREHIESDISLIDVEIDYDFSSKVPKSYEGVSGGALW